MSQNQLFRRRVLVNDGILRAYTNAIKKADKFIYIENQFFVGGSNHWLPPVTKKESKAAQNTVPIAIVDRIVEKVKVGDHLKVYIILPQMPDGKPEGLGTQGILYYQFKTIEMMYSRLNSSLRDLGIQDKTAGDFIQFLCLGKVEWNPEMNRYEPFMIYVHSKLMIIDDEYLIVGSANLNSRSLDGRRDSEICIGCSESYMNSGQIRQFRECLWMEHFGVDNEDTDIRSTLEDTHVLFNPHYHPGFDRVFLKVKQFSTINSSLFENSRLMLNKGRSHILKLPIYEDKGVCKAKLISEFGVSFEGKKPPSILPLTIFV